MLYARRSRVDLCIAGPQPAQRPPRQADVVTRRQLRAEGPLQRSFGGSREARDRDRRCDIPIIERVSTVAILVQKGPVFWCERGSRDNVLPGETRCGTVRS